MNLSRETLKKCGDYIISNGRPLEQALFKHFFSNGQPEKVIEELKKYQNRDGGFGLGLEPDTLLPMSSPFQTTVGLSHLEHFEDIPTTQEMIGKAINYLEYSFDKKRMGWYALPKEVNNYPHTPWWEYNEKDGMTPIDHHYGNPTADIIAYLLRYRQYVKKLNVDELVIYILDYIEKIDQFESEHEIYCFITLYHELTGIKKERLGKVLVKAISGLIEEDSDKWASTYVPQPLHFITNPSMNFLGIDKNVIDKNLMYLIKQLEENVVLLPPWGDSFYPKEFRVSYDAWVSINTLKALMTLNNFNKIEDMGKLI